MFDQVPPELTIAAFVVVALSLLLQAIARFLVASRAPKSEPPPPPSSELEAVEARLAKTEEHLGHAVDAFAEAVNRFESLREGLASSVALESLAHEVRHLEAKIDSAMEQIAELRAELRARTMGETIQPK
jgi:hypothetical protein